MVKKVLLVLLLFIFSSASLAASSANYSIPAENINLGGAGITSVNYKMRGTLRDTKSPNASNPLYVLKRNFFSIIRNLMPSVLGMPLIDSILPNTGHNDGSCTVVIYGANISSDATAKLTKAGQPDMNGIYATIHGPTSIECTFNLAGAQDGSWNVLVTNNGYHKTDILTNGFSVLSSGSKVSIMSVPYNKPNPFNPSEGPTTINFSLSQPTNIAMYMFNQRGELIWQRSFAAAGGSNTITWDGTSDFGEDMPMGVYILIIASKSGSKELGRVRIAILRH